MEYIMNNNLCKKRYQQIRKERKYMPTWAKLADKEKKKFSKFCEKAAMAENKIAGEMYNPDKWVFN